MKKLSKYLLYLGLAIGICHPFLYYSVFSGDGIIYIIFAKNALDGHLFQFNPGQFTGGETSPGFMFIVAALMSMYGGEIIPFLMKTICIFTFYGIGFFYLSLNEDSGFTLPLSSTSRNYCSVVTGNSV